MNKTYVVALFIVLNLLIINISAEENDNPTDQPESSPGMEIIKVGNGQELLLPKGIKTHKIGAQLIVEDNTEYLMNRIVNLEKRLDKLESDNAALKEEIQELKNPAP